MWARICKCRLGLVAYKMNHIDSHCSELILSPRAKHFWGISNFDNWDQMSDFWGLTIMPGAVLLCPVGSNCAAKTPTKCQGTMHLSWSGSGWVCVQGKASASAVFMGQKCCGCSGVKIVLGFQWLHSMAGAWNHESGLSSRSERDQLRERCRHPEGSSWPRWVRAQLRWYSGKDLCCLYTPSKVLYIHILISSRSVVTWVWIIKDLLSRAKFVTQPKAASKKCLFCVSSASQRLVASHLTSFQRPGMIYCDWMGVLLIPTWTLFCVSVCPWFFHGSFFPEIFQPGNSWEFKYVNSSPLKPFCESAF